MKPIKFQPLLFPKIWGGEKIATLKQYKNASAKVGESFEVSALKGECTPEIEGDDHGASLSELIEKYGAELVGENVFQKYGTEFPILIKFIDAREPLSIQVHPDDEMAQREGMPCGKSEMWYVVQADEGASLYAGFSKDVNPDDYEKLLNDGTLTDSVNKYETRAGDAFYIPAGTIHSIGAGNLIIEVQQTSGATYRVYDFDRKDNRGKKRELHVEKARQALNFNARNDFRIDVPKEKNQPVVVKKCEYFNTHVMHLDKVLTRDYSTIDSFVILIAFEGSATLLDSEGNTITMQQGESVLYPACNESIRFTPSGKFSCFETYI